MLLVSTPFSNDRYAVVKAATDIIVEADKILSEMRQDRRLNAEQRKQYEVFDERMSE
jgi:hypothetical protein